MSIGAQVLRRLGVLRAVAIVTFKEWSAYRTHSMVSILVGPVYFLVQYLIWGAVYSSPGAAAGSLRNMDLDAIRLYFAVNALIGYITMDFADWNLGMLVRTGKFLTFALRPIHHRWFALSQKAGHRVLGLVFEFIPCAIIFTLLFRIPLIPAYPLWTILSVGLSFLITFYINYTIGLCAFWLVRPDGIRAAWQLATAVLSGALIPLTFFPVVIQKALFFLPFQYTTYLPAMIWTGRYTLAGTQIPIPQAVGMQTLALLAIALASELVYRASMRHFNGVGA